MVPCKMGDLPDFVSVVLIVDVGFMIVVIRHPNGAKVLRDCEGREWLFARDFPCHYNTVVAHAA